MTLICRGSAVLSSGPLVVPLTLFAASQPQAGVGGRKKNLAKSGSMCGGEGPIPLEEIPRELQGQCGFPVQLDS